jgi:hypothetical protein
MVNCVPTFNDICVTVEEEPVHDRETTHIQFAEDNAASTRAESGNVCIRVEEPDQGSMLNIPPTTLSESSSSETLMGKCRCSAAQYQGEL